MAGQKFNIHQFINSSSNEPSTYTDVFEELEEIRTQNKLRRFSFSIPESDHNPIEIELANINNFNVSPTPPSSPQIIYDKSSITLQIPEDDNFYLEAFPIDSSESDDDKPISDIQTTLHFSKEDLLISSHNDRTVYKKPSRKSADARKIWKQAKIRRSAVTSDIESLLLDWAFTHAFLEIEGKKIKSIIWKSKSNCRCQSTWAAFLKWILCASLG
jgi:hypothetical protein